MAHSTELIFILFLAASIININANFRRQVRLVWLSKPLLMPLLALCYWAAMGRQAEPLILLALGFGAIGDTLLLGTGKRENYCFLVGRGAFMAGHGCYLAWFIGFSLPVRVHTPWVIGAIAGMLILYRFWSHLKKCALPLYGTLVAYGALVGSVAGSTLLCWGTASSIGMLLCLTGALLFAFSDLCIVLRMQGNNLVHEGSAMLFYILADLLLTSGIMVLTT